MKTGIARVLAVVAGALGGGLLSPTLGLAQTRPSVASPAPLTSSTNAQDAVLGAGEVSWRGSYQYRIPIAVPPGIAGMAPSLALVYSSEGGNGMLGQGWSLDGGSQIDRCEGVYASGGVRQRIEGTSADRFCLDGQRLVLISGSNGAVNAVYRTEMDSFARVTITQASGSDPRAWKVEFKDGRMGFYRSWDPDYPTMARRTYRADGTVASTSNVAMHWPLSVVADRAGNAIRWRHEASDDSGTGDVVGWPSEVHYTLCTDDPCPYSGDLREVKFTYEARDTQDVLKNYSSGVAVGIGKRLQKIVMTAGDEVTITREYRFGYRQSSGSKRTLLDSVQMCDGAGACMPATSFTYRDQLGSYSTRSSSADNAFEYTGPLGNANDNSGIDMEMVAYDADGDGNDDVLLHERINGTPRERVVLADGAGYFSEARSVNWSGSTCTKIPHMAMVLPVDLDGNGRSEVVFECSDSTISQGYRVLGWDPSNDELREQNVPGLSGMTVPGWPVAAGQISPTAEGIIKFGDLDGDGLSEMLFGSTSTPTPTNTNGRWKVKKGIATAQAAGTPQISYGTTRTSALLSVGPADQIQGATRLVSQVTTLLDVNGDGRLELTQMDYDAKMRAYSWGTSSGEEVVYTLRDDLLNTTDRQVGTFASEPNANAIWRSPSYLLGGAANQSLWNFADINGDGLKDGFYREEVGNTVRWRMRINTGNGFLPPQEMGAGATTLDAYATDLLKLQNTVVQKGLDNGLRTGDMNGDGRDDIVLFDPGGSLTSHASGYNQTRGSVRVLYSNGKGFEAPVSLPTYPSGYQRLRDDFPEGVNPRWLMSALADIDGDGLMDVVELVADQAARRRLVATKLALPGGIDLMIGVRQNSVDRESVTYDNMARNINDSYTPAKITTYPLAAAGRRAIVSRHVAIVPGHSQVAYNYDYQGGLIDLSGRGFLGFNKIEKRNGATGESTVSSFDFTPVIAGATYNLFPHASRPSRIEHQRPLTGGGHDASLVDASGTIPEPLETWRASFTGFPLRMLSQTTRSSVDRSATNFVSYVEESATYDDFGNPTDVTTTTVDATNNATSLDNAKVYTKVVVSEYDNDVDNWLLNQRTARFETTRSNAVANARQYDAGLDVPYTTTDDYDMSYSYDDRGLMTRAVRRPGASMDGQGLRTILVYERDNAGLITTRRRYGANTGDRRACTANSDCNSNEHCMRALEPTGQQQCLVHRTTTIQFDATGSAPEGFTNALGHTTWRLYDSTRGWYYAAVDQNGVKTLTTRDGFGRVRESRSDTGQGSAITYDGRAIRETLRSGGRRVTFLDAIGRSEYSAWLAFDGGAGVSKRRYDALGNVIDERYNSTATAFASVDDSTTTINTALGTGTVISSASFDAAGRPASATKGSNETTTYSYESPIGKVTTTDARGLVASRVTDIRGNLVSITQRNNGGTDFTTTYGYYGDGILASIRSAADSLVERFTRDLVGRPRSWSSAHTNAASPQAISRWLTRDYNGFDEPLELQRDGIVNTLVYDALGRVTQRNAENESQLFNWDAPNELGLLNEASFAGHTTSFNYDLGRIASRREAFADGTSLSMRFAYNSAGQLSRIDYPGSAGSGDTFAVTHTLPEAAPKIHYSYQNGYMHRLRLGSTTGAILWQANARHPYGMLTAAEQNGLVNSLTYDANTLRLDTQSTTGVTSGPVPNQNFDYFANGTLSNRTTTGLNERFDYDGSRSFLRTYHRDAGSTQIVDAAFVYGSQGIAGIDTTASTGSSDWPISDETYSYNGASVEERVTQQLLSHQIGSATASSFTYDSAGRVTQVSEGATLKRRYTWNSFNLPKKVEHFGPNLTRDFLYNGLGHRVNKKQNTDNQVWYMDKFYEARNLTALNTKESVFRLFADGGVVAERAYPWSGTGVTTRSIILDQQGSPAYEISGTTSTQRGFFPFGKRMGNAPAQNFSQIGYTGHRQDDDIGLIDMGGRVFDIRTRRFLTRDITLDQPFTTFGNQAYSYVSNNPTSFIDPSGYQAAAYQGSSSADYGINGKGAQAQFEEVTKNKSLLCSSEANLCAGEDTITGEVPDNAGVGPESADEGDEEGETEPLPKPPAGGHGQSAGRSSVFTSPQAINSIGQQFNNPFRNQNMTHASSGQQSRPSAAPSAPSTAPSAPSQPSLIPFFAGPGTVPVFAGPGTMFAVHTTPEQADAINSGYATSMSFVLSLMAPGAAAGAGALALRESSKMRLLVNLAAKGDDVALRELEDLLVVHAAKSAAHQSARKGSVEYLAADQLAIAAERKETWDVILKNAVREWFLESPKK